MPCVRVSLPDGGYAIVRMARRRAKPCATCGSPSVVLCDHPVTRNGKPGTCSRPCCRKCSTPVGKDRDYCLEHSQ